MQSWTKQPTSTASINRSSLAGRAVCCAWVAGTPYLELDRNKAVVTNGGVPTWISTARRGRSARFTDVNQGLILASSSAFLPLKEITVVLHWRKTDATLRVAGAFGPATTTAGERLGAHMPYSDGTLYFDFGINSGSGRLTAAGLTYGNDIWVLTAGPRGMEIWQNGFLRASSGTPPAARTVTTTAFWLNAYNTLGDLAESSMFAVLRRQMPQAICRSLCYNPWQLFAPVRGVAVFSEVAAAGNANLLHGKFGGLFVGKLG